MIEKIAIPSIPVVKFCERLPFSKTGTERLGIGFPLLSSAVRLKPTVPPVRMAVELVAVRSRVCNTGVDTAFTVIETVLLTILNGALSNDNRLGKASLTGEAHIDTRKLHSCL